MSKTQTPTPHIEANYDDIAKTVVMPGDPLRAKLIADKFLENAKVVNEVRGMYAITGNYKGQKITAMGSGMGMPSMGIYSYELFNFYDVDNIIRVGTCGAYSPKLHLNDMIAAMGLCMVSDYAKQYELPGTFCPIADWDLLKFAVETFEEYGCNYQIGNMLSTDIFYEPEGWGEKWPKLGVLGVEMESGALYCNAAAAGKRALTIATVSDHFIYTDEILSSEERQTSLMDMLKAGMEVAYKASQLESV